MIEENMTVKQYRVTKTTELVSSYIIEVPEGEDLNELLQNNYRDGWEKHVLDVVYENDVCATHVLEAWTLKEPVDAGSPLVHDFGNDDQRIHEDKE